MNGTSPKLQRTTRTFLLRLVAENGIEDAAHVLRGLADKIEGLAEEEGDLPQFDL